MSPSPRRLLRWTAITAGILLALLSAGAAGGYAMSQSRLRAAVSPPDHPLVVTEDSASVAHGRYLATVRGCVDCHGDNLGGTVMIEDPAMGRLVARNLTSGRTGGPLTDREWELAVRHALRADGTKLLFMPADEFTGYSDQDVAAIAAYVRTLPAVPDTLGATRIGPMARALHLAGEFSLLPAEKIDHSVSHPATVIPEPTAEYGKYIAAGCTGCHGPGFSGGKIPGTPPDWAPASNITPSGIGSWSEADFFRALREGVRPDGSTLNELMPVRILREMTDVETRALWLYLQTLPPKAYGGR
jgi:cytochrome c553